jgi:hypothetical protein
MFLNVVTIHVVICIPQTRNQTKLGVAHILGVE